MRFGPELTLTPRAPHHSPGRTHQPRAPGLIRSFRAAVPRLRAHGPLVYVATATILLTPEVVTSQSRGGGLRGGACGPLGRGKDQAQTPWGATGSVPGPRWGLVNGSVLPPSFIIVTVLRLVFIPPSLTQSAPSPVRGPFCSADLTSSRGGSESVVLGPAASEMPGTPWSSKCSPAPWAAALGGGSLCVEASPPGTPEPAEVGSHCSGGCERRGRKTQSQAVSQQRGGATVIKSQLLSYAQRAVAPNLVLGTPHLSVAKILTPSPPPPW